MVPKIQVDSCANRTQYYITDNRNNYLYLGESRSNIHYFGSVPAVASAFHVYSRTRETIEDKATQKIAKELIKYNCYCLDNRIIQFDFSYLKTLIKEEGFLCDRESNHLSHTTKKIRHIKAYY